MTPDNWERRTIPFVDGWNKAPETTPAAVFTPTYDHPTDTVVINSTQPVFTGVDTIEFTSLGSSGTLVLGVDFEINSASQIVVIDAVLNLAGGGIDDVTEFIFLDGLVEVGRWDGSVQVGQLTSQISSSSYGTWYNATTGGTWSCAAAAAAAEIAGIFVYVDNPTPTIDGLRVTGVDDAGDPWTKDYTVTGTPGNFVTGADNPPDGFFVIIDDELEGKTMQQVGALDAAGNLLDGMVQNDYVWAVGTLVSSPAPNTIRVEFDAFDLDIPTELTLVSCAAGVNDGGITVYDPDGPDSGDNHPDITINTWTNGVIEVAGDPLPDTPESVVIEFAQAGVGGGAGGAFTRYGNPVVTIT